MDGQANRYLAWPEAYAGRAWSDGTTQATYNGHPLYTYAGDTAPGQDKGNGINASGGLWYTVPVTGSAAPAAGSSAKSNSGGYGY